MKSLLEDDYKNRQIIPRLNTFEIATALGETQSLSSTADAKLYTEKTYLEKKEDWKNNKSVLFASDLVGTALIAADYSDPLAKEAALLIRKQSEIPLELELANKFLKNQKINSKVLTKKDEYLEQIRKIKSDLSSYQKDATRWVDLAFYYTAIAQNVQAKKCMSVALALAGDNRFVLRSASRLFMHLNDSERALFYLRKSSMAKLDPWLIAAEISISESVNNSSQRTSHAKRLLENISVGSLSISELAGAMGTLELNYGGTKKAKKMLKLSLEQPTENSLAQATWINKHKALNLELPKVQSAFQFEANSNLFYTEGNFQEAFEEAWRWLNFQPFSSRPAVIGSFIACTLLEKYDDAIEIIERGRVASPNDFLLSNNLAFSYASKNKTAKAEEVFRSIERMSLGEVEKATALATKGLIEYRKGNAHLGRSFYDQAIAIFKDLKDSRALTLASYFLAREEAKLKTKESLIIAEQAVELAKKVNFKELIPLLSKFNKK